MPIKNILVVDDSPTDRQYLSDILTKSGYKVSTASSAEEALAKVKAAAPDLVLMDVVMPGQNGYQATRQLTKDDATKHIPAIICTMPATTTMMATTIRISSSVKALRRASRRRRFIMVLPPPETPSGFYPRG